MPFRPLDQPLAPAVPSDVIPAPEPQRVPSRLPDGTIHLKIRRSQKQGILGGKPTFTLDARIELSAQDQELVRKYGLGDQVVYDSKARRTRAETAYGNFDAAVTQSYSSVGRSLWSNAKGLAATAMMSLSLRVTVNSLMRGQHIAAKELDELLAAEAAIVEACRNLKVYLETAVSFDGREELIEI